MRNADRNGYDECRRRGRCNERDVRNGCCDRKAAEEKNAPNDYPSFMAIILFVTGIALAVMLLFAASVLWLGELLNSTALACAIVGAATAIASIILYFCSLHKALRRISDQLETVYETSRIAKAGYDKVKTWLNYIVNL